MNEEQLRARVAELESRLAEIEAQEPVAWRTDDWKIIVRTEHAAMWPSANIPLYARPVPADCTCKGSQPT